jgi:hypothetical protein
LVKKNCRNPLRVSNPSKKKHKEGGKMIRRWQFVCIQMTLPGVIFLAVSLSTQPVLRSIKTVHHS